MVTKGNLIRWTRGGGTIGVPPTNLTLPEIEDIGSPPEVGDLLTCSTGTWAGSPTLFTFQWRRGDENIDGATLLSYQLTEGDEGALVACLVTASNTAGSTGAVSLSVGPVEPASAPPADTGRDYLTASARARADAIQSVFDSQDWRPYIDSVSWDDTIIVPNGSEFHKWIRSGNADVAGTYAISGVVRDPTRNQRLRLAAGGDFTYAGSIGSSGTPGVFELRGGRPSDNGKVLLIEPETTSPQITARFIGSGCRGVYFRNLDWVGGIDDWGAVARPAVGSRAEEAAHVYFAPQTLRGVKIIAPGAGYAVGDPLTFEGTFDVAPVVTVGQVDGEGGILDVDIAYGGKYLVTQTNLSLVSSVTVESAAGLGADLAAVCWNTNTVNLLPGTTSNANPRDMSCITLQRAANTAPALPIVIIEGGKIGKGHTSTDPQRYGSGIAAINCEQATIKRVAFKGCETGLKIITVRRALWHQNDFQQMIGDVCINTNINVDTVVSGGETYGSVYLDRIGYEWVRLNTRRNMVDDCARFTARGEDLRFDQAHADFSQHGTSGDRGGYVFLFEYNADYAERETHADRNGSFRNNTQSTVRVTGGTQGGYNDDAGASYNLDQVSYANLITVNTAIGLTAYNGVTDIERNHVLRAGRIAANAVSGTDGFDYSTDVASNVTVRKKSGAATAHASVLNNILTTVASLSTVVDSLAAPIEPAENGNLLCDPRVTAAEGARLQDVFPTSTFTSINGHNGYVFDDDGGGSQAEFRAALFAQFPHASKGAPDPATWPIE